MAKVRPQVHLVFTLRYNHGMMIRSRLGGRHKLVLVRKRKIFEPLESVTVKDAKEIVAESLSRNYRVYNRLAEI